MTDVGEVIRNGTNRLLLFGAGARGTALPDPVVAVENWLRYGPVGGAHGATYLAQRACQGRNRCGSTFVLLVGRAGLEPATEGL